MMSNEKRRAMLQHLHHKYTWICLYCGKKEPSRIKLIAEVGDINSNGELRLWYHSVTACFDLCTPMPALV